MDQSSVQQNPRAGDKPFRSHGWSANIMREIDHDDCIDITAEKGTVTTRIAVLYSSSGILNAKYRELSKRVDHIFFSGQPYMLDSFTKGVTVPVEPLGDFFPFLVNLNKQVEPDRSPPVTPRRTVTVRRLTAEHPLEAVITRLQQFTSVKLAAKLVERRAATEGMPISHEMISGKATGIAYSMRSALDYMVCTSSDKLNRRVLGLYLRHHGFCPGGNVGVAIGASRSGRSRRDDEARPRTLYVAGAEWWVC